jgi:hypothetical protein
LGAIVAVAAHNSHSETECTRRNPVPLSTLAATNLPRQQSKDTQSLSSPEFIKQSENEVILFLNDKPEQHSHIQ